MRSSRWLAEASVNILIFVPIQMLLDIAVLRLKYSQSSILLLEGSSLLDPAVLDIRHLQSIDRSHLDLMNIQE